MGVNYFPLPESVARWTRFQVAKPAPGAEVIVLYPSGVKAYGEWGKTFKEGIDPTAKWVQLPQVED